MRRRRSTGRGRLALLVAPLALVLTGCSAKDWERDLRFGWPTGVTKQGEEMRDIQHLAVRQGDLAAGILLEINLRNGGAHRIQDLGPAGYKLDTIDAERD